MPRVKLKVNMIFGGSYYTFGTVLDRDEVPLNLRKKKYLADPNEEEKIRLQEEELFLDDVGEVQFEEELPPTVIPSDSRAKHFKPKPKL